jgi:putative transcriptional regulator
MVKTKVAELLAKKGKSLYWLAKESGVPYNTLIRWRDSTTDSFHSSVLERICRALECEIGDVLEIVE